MRPRAGWPSPSPHPRQILSHDFFKDQRLTIDWEKRELVVDGKD